MAGTLTISTLSDGTNSTSSTNCIQGSAKAWVTYKGTSTQAILASYNVSSVTYSSTGNYIINLTNALADTNYAIAGSARYSGSGAVTINIQQAGTLTTSAIPIIAIVTGVAAVDVTPVSVAVFR
jgi:hypothetical protein